MKRLLFKTFWIVPVLLLALPGGPRAQTTDLYVDKKTKQVFTEPGEGREKLVTIKPATEQIRHTLDDIDAFSDRVDAIREAYGDDEDDDPYGFRKPSSISDDAIRYPRRRGVRLAQFNPARDPKEGRDLRNDGSVIGTVMVDGVVYDVNGFPAGDRAKKWYEKINIRGYTLFRYNETIDGDTKLIRHYADASLGKDRSFFIRRMRIILFGDISENLYWYVQPDFASTPGGSDTGNFAQLRDAYADVTFDAKKEFRLRLGQSKVPYGFENMQSSQNRLALDRNDAFNSAVKDERDTGAFFYWAPQEIRTRFRELVTSGLKGSGDYGVFAIGAYNGTGANRPEVNDMLHLVTRLTYPFKFANGQFFEASVQAYKGTYKPTTDSTVRSKSAPSGFNDERVGISAILYPQPFGLQAEWNWGKTPTLNANHNLINEGQLTGGYVQAMYKIDNVRGSKPNNGTLIPFFKWQYFDGAMKAERNAPRVFLDEKELGFEYQPSEYLELVMELVNTSRTNYINYQQANANLLRIQMQWNY